MCLNDCFSCSVQCEKPWVKTSLEVARLQSQFKFVPKIYTGFSKQDLRVLISALMNYERKPNALNIRRVRRLIRLFDSLLENFSGNNVISEVTLDE